MTDVLPDPDVRTDVVRELADDLVLLQTRASSWYRALGSSVVGVLCSSVMPVHDLWGLWSSQGGVKYRV